LSFGPSDLPSFLTVAFGMVVRDAIACPKTTDPTGRKKSWEIAVETAVVRENCVRSGGVSLESGSIPSSLPEAACIFLKEWLPP